MDSEMVRGCRDNQMKSSRHLNKYAVANSVLASMTSVLLGYNVGAMSGVVLFIKEDMKITSIQAEILVGSLNISSLVGSLASGKICDSIGRRNTIILASTTFLVASLLMAFAPSFPFLVAGRVVAGIGVGLSLVMAPVYISELAPAPIRGLLTSLPEVFINLGILLGYILNYALAGLAEKIRWRFMIGVPAIPSIAIAVAVVVAMPESPRWLVMGGRLEEAKRVLIRTSISAEEAELRLAEITQEAITASSSSTGGVWRELLLRPSRPVRRILVLAVGINFFMQASGNDAIMYYCPEVFSTAGIHKKKPLLGITILMGLVKTFFVFLAATFSDRFGRRPLLLVGSTGMTASLATLGLGSIILERQEKKSKWAIAMCVVSLCADVSFFAIGLGPLTWVYSSEIFPTRLRAQGSSIAVAVNRIISSVVSMSFLSISKAISFGGSFFVCAGIAGVGMLFFYLLLPETKGKRLEEIWELFKDRDVGGEGQ